MGVRMGGMHTPTIFPIPPNLSTHTLFMAIPIPNQKAGSCALPVLKIQVVDCTKTYSMYSDCNADLQKFLHHFNISICHSHM